MQNAKVLIVDDDTDYSALVRDYLHENGLSILEVSSGDKALETALNELPDVILLDVMLRGMSGYEICRALKADRRTWNIPIVMVSARVGFQDKMQGFLVGAHRYITKPCDLEDIRESIYNTIGNNRASGRLARDVEIH